MILVVYVNDILLTGSDIAGIAKTKIYLESHFVTKEMGRPRYFLWIEFAYQKNKLMLSQRNYALDLLPKADLLECKPKSTPVVPNSYFWDDFSKLLKAPSRYKRLNGKLIYLIVTRLDIAYVVSLLSQFMHEPREVHWIGAICVLSYIK